jgi:hypothetical protein
MKILKTILFCAAFVAAGSASAQYFISSFKTDVSKVGTTAAPFLTIGVGARANAMGGAFVSVANDVTSLYWNPSGLARLRSNQLTLIHNKWIADLSHDFIGAAFNMGNLGTIGVSLNALTMDDIIVRTPELPDGTGERAGSYDLALGLSFARGLTDRLCLGGTVKYVTSRLWHMSSSTVAFDCGVLFSEIFNFFQLGASISNVGGKMQFNGRDTFVYYDMYTNEYGNNDKIDAEMKTGAFNLPVCFRAGLSAVVNRSSSIPLLLAVEFYEPSDNVRSLSVGGEWAFWDKVFMRAGYNSLFELDSERGLTLGGGLKVKVPRSTVQVNLDYSYEDFGLFQNAQKLALALSF